ncbi:MAG TPA: type IV pilus secretin PilQ [Myxococcota bacterium]|nr:type IV pilus secretin PilQ [Myxococcota bacterium]
MFRNNLMDGVLTRAVGSLLLALALGCASAPVAEDEGASEDIGLASEESATESASDPAQEPWSQANDAESAAADAARIAADAAAAAAPATKLTGASVREADGVVLVELAADGRIDGAEVFTVEDPLRLVVDLPGLKSEGVPARSDVAGALISRVRVAQHESKVRVVVDAADGVTSFPAQTSQALAGGLSIALGGEAPASALAAESTDSASDEAPIVAEGSSEEEISPVEQPTEPVPAAPAEEMAATPASQTVLGVQFDSSSERDRVVIVSDGAARYSAWEPDAETYVVRIGGATIDPAAQVRIAPENPGVISLVTAFEQPEMKEPEVRVVITRAAGVKPSVTQNGAMLVVDFANTAKAAAVPMMAAALEEPASQPAVSAPSAPAIPSGPVEQTISSKKQQAPASIDGNGSIDELEEGGLLTGKVYGGRRISLDFKDVEIDDVLRLIAEVSELNVIAGDEVSGQVTIRLVDVPWDQALDVILLTKGLGFVRVGNVLRIAPTEVLKTEEEARLQERRAKEKLEDLVVKLQPVNYATVKDVAAMVKKLLSARGTVDIDARTNTVILKDIASVIDEATALIKAIDTQTPQVMVEAKIVEANLDFLREVGSNWGVGVQGRTDAWDPDSDPLTSSTSRKALGSDGFRLRNVDGLGSGGNSNSFAVSNPITELATGAINLGAFILDERFDVDLTLAGAESHGEGKVISSPRVVTLDNRKARIEQGVSIPFQTFEDGDAKLEFIDAVLALDVTPHITADRSIIMQVEVQRNAPDDSVPTPTGSPAIAKNQAKTETLVKDGQTLVIGGIYVVRTADRESRVPYFHRVPVIGNAFKSKEVRDIRQELLVFITPRIVVNPELGS